MDKKLKKALWEQLTAKVLGEFTHFDVHKEKTIYLDSSELVFRSLELIAPKAAFIIIVPHHNGYDSFTVEIAWSVDQNFPQLSMRPSAAPTQSEAAQSRPQAALRLFTLDEINREEFIQVRSDNLNELVDLVMHDLRVKGLPYLCRVVS